MEDEEDGVDAMANQIAGLCDKIAERQKSHSFPAVLPSELESNSEMEAADLTLGLVAKELHVMVESNFAEEKRKFLISQPYNPSKSIREQGNDYTYRLWYVHFAGF